MRECKGFYTIPLHTETAPAVRKHPGTTVIGRVEGGKVGLVYANHEDGRALSVFRSPEEAEKFVAYGGKGSPEEGFRFRTLDHEELEVLLHIGDYRYVDMPEPWIGEDGCVDTFTAENFITLLKESLVKRGTA